MAAIQEHPRTTTIPAFLRISDWRIGFKLLIAFLTAAIIPLVLSGILSYRTSRDALLTQGISNLVARSTSTSDAIDQFLEAHKEDIGTYMTLPPLVAFATNPNDAAARANALRVLPSLTNRKYYESIAIADAGGIIILSSTGSDVNTSIQSFNYFQQALKGTNYISDPWVSPTTNQPSLFFSAPIVNSGGNILGVLVTRVSLYGIWDLVDSDLDSVGAGTFGVLLDENGIRIADSASRGRRAAADKLLYTAIAPLADATVKQIVTEKRLGVATADTVAVTPLPEIAAAVGNPNVTTFESAAENSAVRHYAAVRAISTKPWHYVLMTPLSTFTGAADALALEFFLLIVIVAVFTCVVVFFIARGFTGPIIQLTKVADRISMGELDVQIGIDRKDEIGQLAEAIGRMQTSLQTMIERFHARRPS